MIEKGYFYFEVSPTEVLDLGDMKPAEWREIKKRASQIIAAEQTSNSNIAFVAAFMNYMMERQNMKKPFQIDA